MSAGDAARTCFGVETVSERCADCQDASAGTLPRFEDDDRPPGLSKHIRGAQPGETGADHDDGSAGAGKALFRDLLQQ